MLKTTNTVNVVSKQIQKDATYYLDRKKIYLISIKSFWYYTLWSSIIFRHILYIVDFS